MSLAKKLRRFFAEVRREAKRNPAFAARLESALDALAPDDLLDDDEADLDGAEAADGLGEGMASGAGGYMALEVNPVAIARRDGADALAAVLADLPETALRGLIAEHNLDPAEETVRQKKEALAAHIVRQAVRRIQRDAKLFEY